jgi:hypothetical protein
MSVEQKIREFLQGTTVAEAYPGFGKNRDAESPMQGGSQKPQVNNLDKGAGADAAMKAGKATSLAAGSGPMDKKNPTQGSSDANPEQEDLGTDMPGKVAAGKMSKTTKHPAGKGAGKAKTTTSGVDPATVVNQPTSKGNVYKEDVELGDDDEIITEDEFNALSPEEQAEYEAVFTDDTEDTLEEAKKEIEDEDEDEEEDGDEKKKMPFMKKKDMKEEQELDETMKLYTAAARNAAKDAHSKGMDRDSAHQHIYKSVMGVVSSNSKADRSPMLVRAQSDQAMEHGENHYSKLSSKASKSVKKEQFEFDVNSLFESDEHLSEEFKTKAASLFEAVVTARVAELREQIEESAAEAAAEVIMQTQEEMVEKVDAYLNYVVEQWMEQNEVAVVNGLRNEVTEDFINGLRNLFAENYIEVPEERYDVLGEMQAKIEELEGALNEQIDHTISLNEELISIKRDGAISYVCEDLAQTEIEKFKSLIEEVTFEDEESYIEKLSVIKGNYFPNSQPVVSSSEDLTESTEDVEVSSSVSKYVSALSKTSFSK